MSQEHFDRFKKIAVGTLNVEESKLVPEARFKEDLECDSLDMVSFVMDLEAEFQLPEIPSEEYENLSTVQDAFNLILSKIS